MKSVLLLKRYVLTEEILVPVSMAIIEHFYLNKEDSVLKETLTDSTKILKLNKSLNFANEMIKS
jgi:hypothetical protein